MDIVSFQDVDSCNFLTASVVDSSAIAWSMEGANSEGLLGDANLCAKILE